MKERSVDYFRERERAEREAAKNATCDAARWAHQEMADTYARMLQGLEPDLPDPAQLEPIQLEPIQMEPIQMEPRQTES